MIFFGLTRVGLSLKVTIPAASAATGEEAPDIRSESFCGLDFYFGTKAMYLVFNFQ
jgi:hypothetical protein